MLEGKNIDRDEINIPKEDKRNSGCYVKGKNAGLHGVKEKKRCGVGRSRRELAEKNGVWKPQWERTCSGQQGKGRTHRELDTEVFKQLRICLFLFEI